MSCRDGGIMERDFVQMNQTIKCSSFKRYKTLAIYFANFEDFGLHPHAVLDGTKPRRGLILQKEKSLHQLQSIDALPNLQASKTTTRKKK